MKASKESHPKKLLYSDADLPPARMLSVTDVLCDQLDTNIHIDKYFHFSTFKFLALDYRRSKTVIHN
jgi:hypothetical protein